jgi:competence protein ComEC
MHILAVSGLHVGILYYIILFLVTKGNTRRRLTLTQASIIIGFIWSYAIIAGLPTSVIRAGIMFTFLLVGKSLNKSNNTYNSISLAAIIILLIDPTELFTVSFQLSFIAVLSIISLYPIIAKAWEPKNKIIDYCWQIVTVSLAAQLGVLGLSIFYFHTFPSYFLIANLFAIPLSGLVLILSITSLICTPIPLLSDILFWLLDKIIVILNSLLGFISNLPGNSIEWLHLSNGLIVFMGGLILLFFQFLRTKKRSLLHLMMLGIVLFTGMITTEHLLIRKKTEFWVYQTPGATTMGLLENKNNYLFCIDVDSSDIRYHLRDHWIKTYRNKPHRSFPNLYQVGPNYIGKIDNKNFAVISDVTAMPAIGVHYHFVVYVSNALRKAAPIKECDLNIVDGSNSYYLCRELQERYQGTSTTFHFTSIDGARRIPLSSTY